MEKLIRAEKEKAAHHLINLFPDMTIDYAMQLDIEDINTRINNRIAEIENTLPPKTQSLNQQVRSGMVNDIDTMIGLLKGIGGSLSAIQKLQEAKSLIEKL